MDGILKRIQNIIAKDEYKECKLATEVNQAISEFDLLHLMTIGALKGRKFNIPAYQRGYRWKTQQVCDLLNDIWEFACKENKGETEFYCLQPVVVMDKAGKWDVIDGQQRLTTIFLIIKYLTENDDNFFHIEYETRTDSTDFLENIGNASDKSNIDYFHINQAYSAIKEWFDKKEINQDKWESTFLDRTKIIWYKVTTVENGKAVQNSIDFFTRLNNGKIPLTNSEMIRALFLLKCYTESDSAELKIAKQQKLASEWDNLERELQNEDFWGFITLNSPFKKDYPNRIEYIFDLIENGSERDRQDKYSTYRMYEKLLNGEASGKTEELWLAVKQYYWRFHEWFIDDEIYHLLGYLWFIGKYKVDAAFQDAKSNKQSVFIKRLRQKIKDILKVDLIEKVLREDSVDVNPTDSLRYGENNEEIKNILKWFNVYTHKQEKTRCPFASYKNTLWSLEHIHAQNSSDLSGDDWERWANEVAGDDKGLNEILEKRNGIESISSVRKEFEATVAERFGDIGDYMHTLMNMALLGKSPNSALGNKVFPRKREEVLKFIEDDKYLVPIATKNVFLKYYSNNPGEMQKWTVADCRSYGNKLIECLKSI
jgi:uncharacterized protein with ParB-like and HNH nuclease domain